MHLHPLLSPGAIRRAALVAGLALGPAAAAWAADTGSMAVSAVVPTRTICLFWTGRNPTLAFGNIDPSSVVNATASTTFTIRCLGFSATAAYTITAGNGLYASGPGSRRMRHATNTSEFLPYSLNFSPVAGVIPRNTTHTITVTGTIQPFQFANAAQGAYSDTVVVNVDP